MWNLKATRAVFFTFLYLHMKSFLFADSQPPDVTHNTAQQSRRLTAADRVNRYNQSRQSSVSDESMGEYT